MGQPCYPMSLQREPQGFEFAESGPANRGAFYLKKSEKIGTFCDRCRRFLTLELFTFAVICESCKVALEREQS